MSQNISTRCGSIAHFLHWATAVLIVATVSCGRVTYPKGIISAMRDARLKVAQFSGHLSVGLWHECDLVSELSAIR